MKKYISLITLFMIITLVSGCTEDHTTYFTVSDDNISLNTQGDEQEIIVNGESKYWTYKCSNKWILCEKVEQTLKISAPYNLSNERKGYITIFYRDEMIAQINVSQDAMKTAIYSIPQEGGNKAFYLPTSEIDTLKCSQNWLDIEMLHDSIFISAETNSGKYREALLYARINDGQTILVCTVQQEGLYISEDMIHMIYIQGGTYYQGAQAIDPNMPRYDYLATEVEGPVHKVTLSNYFISKDEINQDLWTKVMGYNNSAVQHPLLPVTNVTIDEVKEFITQLNTILGTNYRLPTEWEWEYAARERGQDNYIYSGSNNIDNIGWYYSNSFKMVNFCGLKQPNSLGIYDMTGNVMEMCSGNYITYPDYQLEDPYFEIDNNLIVARGGAWNSPENNCRNTYRYTFDKTYSSDNIGFRLVK